MIGRVMGNFRIVSKLGDGGMGSVFRARDEMLDRDVALKILKPELARQSGLIERFRQEAIALARLNHPRIGALHGLERHGEELVMVMELLRGETLEALVHRTGGVTWNQAAELCCDILEALSHAHEMGVVHRDIKPANAMLTPDGRVKVMDFGIARLKDKNRQTRMGHAVGTPMYMSPEQLRGEEVDGRADLYAVGAVLFELITGRMAFEADSDYELMMKQLNDPPRPPSALVGGIPPAIDEIVVRAMAKRRDDRFDDAIAMRNALVDALGGTQVGMRRSLTPPESFSTGVVEPAFAAEPGVPPATRLAVDSGGPTPATRLASDAAGGGIPATRLGPAAGTTVSAPVGAARLVKDWRAWGAAAVLLFAAGLAIRAATSGPDQPTAAGDSTEAPSAAPGPSIPQVTADPVRDTTAVLASRGTTSPVPPPPDFSGATPGPPPGGADPVVPRIAPPPVLGTDPVRPPLGGRTRTAPVAPAPVQPAPEPPPITRDPAPEPVKPPVAEKEKEPAPVPTPPEAESRSTMLAGVLSAINGFAGNVGRGSADAVQVVLRGDEKFTSEFVGLVRQGRVQMSVVGAPEVDGGGTQATARFNTSLNVRSPFGGNRRRSASFVADLVRSGGPWTLSSVRPAAAIDLK